KLAFTWATPDVMFLRSFLRTRAFFSVAISVSLPFGYARRTPAWNSLAFGRDLLAGDRLRGTFARARVGVRALTANRQTFAMTQAAIAAEVHEALDVHRHFAAQVAFDHVLAVDDLADLNDFGVRELIDAALLFDADALANLDRIHGADAMDVAQRNVH